MASDDQSARLGALTLGAVSGMGLLVEEITVTPAGRRRVVRIALDRDLSGVDENDGVGIIPPLSLDEVADASRAIDAALEETALFGAAPYVLEVTSPGADRPLTEWRHYRRNVGRLVGLVSGDGSEISGRLVEVSPSTIVVDMGDGGRRTLPIPDISRARVHVEFGHASDTEES